MDTLLLGNKVASVADLPKSGSAAFSINYPSRQELALVADCHIKAFPDALASKLGKSYVAKMLEWYLTTPNKFLFALVKQDATIVGYCGGYVRKNEPFGSSSGMTQHAFWKGLWALACRPWLLADESVLSNLRFLARNVANKLLPAPSAAVSHKTKSTIPLSETSGLVVIAVHPDFQGEGHAAALLEEFERKSKLFGCRAMQLSVRSDNEKAIRSYLKNGWAIARTFDSSHTMEKLIS